MIGVAPRQRRLGKGQHGEIILDWTAIMKPNEQFLDDLCHALRVRGKPISKRERALAQKLHQSLWEAAKFTRNTKSDTHARKRSATRESERAHAELAIAREVASLATQL